jgi:membrane-anchored glycerophosphoryl diester phosphodiesterase (GDPDase)
MIDIGRVFATAWAMLRQRFWLLLGMFAVFFAIQMVAWVVLTIALAVTGVAGAASIGAGFDDPAAITGMSVFIVVFVVLFYGAYMVLLLAQQAAMVTLASPLEEASFSTAMVRGFKSVLPFFAIAVILGLAYFALALLVFGAAGAAGVGGGATGGIFGTVLLVLFMPVMVYLGCRMAVLVAVVAVDQVFNPIAAIRRSWAVTRGRVVGIALAFLLYGLLTLVIFGLPIGLIFTTALSGDPASGLPLLLLLLPLVFLPVLVVYVIFASSFSAALHSEVTGGGAERLEEVFA